MILWQWLKGSMICVVNNLCSWQLMWLMTFVIDNLCVWLPIWLKTCVFNDLYSSRPLMAYARPPMAQPIQTWPIQATTREYHPLDNIYHFLHYPNHGCLWYIRTSGYQHINKSTIFNCCLQFGDGQYSRHRNQHLPTPWWWILIGVRHSTQFTGLIGSYKNILSVYWKVVAEETWLHWT